MTMIISRLVFGKATVDMSFDMSSIGFVAAAWGMFVGFIVAEADVSDML